MNEITKNILIVFGTINAIAALLLLSYLYAAKIKRKKIRHFGDIAEEQVSQYILSAFPGAVLINNIFLKTDFGLTQIDHILLCRWGVFVIETKSHNGKIVIGKRDWIQHYNNKIIRFHNPSLQNEIHIKALKRVLNNDRELARTPINGIVVFTSKKVRLSQKVDGVIQLNELNRYIKSGNAAKSKTPSRRAGGRYLSASTIKKIETIILQNSEKSKLKHYRHSNKVNKYNSTFNSVSAV